MHASFSSQGDLVEGMVEAFAGAQGSVVAISLTLPIESVQKAQALDKKKTVGQLIREMFKKGGKAKKKKKAKSRVNEAGNYTKPELRKRIFQRIKAGSKGGKPGQWSARKAQMLAQAYKKAGGGYKS